MATVRITHTIERTILGYLRAVTKCPGLGGVLAKACLAVLGISMKLQRRTLLQTVRVIAV